MKKFLLILVVAIVLLVPSCKAPTESPVNQIANHRPVITSVEAERAAVLTSESCQIECIALDEDGDEMSYEWSASKGEIDGKGPTVIWIAPEIEGIFRIMVRVTDGKGGEVTDSTTITVRVNRPPRVTSLIADVDWLTSSRNCQVECAAEDPDGDELSYEWSTNGGDISGTGSMVTWTAPKNGGKVNVIVTVSDSRGGVASKSVVFNVKICAACSFK